MCNSLLENYETTKIRDGQRNIFFSWLHPSHDFVTDVDGMMSKHNIDVQIGSIAFTAGIMQPNMLPALTTVFNFCFVISLLTTDIEMLDLRHVLTHTSIVILGLRVLSGGIIPRGRMFISQTSDDGHHVRTRYQRWIVGLLRCLIARVVETHSSSALATERLGEGHFA